MYSTNPFSPSNPTAGAPGIPKALLRFFVNVNISSYSPDVFKPSADLKESSFVILVISSLVKALIIL